MTDERKRQWRAYFAARGQRGHWVAPADFARELGGEVPADVAYVVTSHDHLDAITGFDVDHRAVWSRGVGRRL